MTYGLLNLKISCMQIHFSGLGLHIYQGVVQLHNRQIAEQASPHHCRNAPRLMQSMLVAVVFTGLKANYGKMHVVLVPWKTHLALKIKT